MSAPYSLDSDLLIYGEDRLNDALQDEAQRPERVADARAQADDRIDLMIGACYPVSLKVELTGTWTVSAASKDLVGTGTAALAELKSRQMITLEGEDHMVAAVIDEASVTLRDVHVAGATGGTAIATPRAFDSLVRWWSSTLTLSHLLPGATAGSDSLKAAIANVERSIADVCSGALPLGDLVRTNAAIGAAFVPLAEDHLPDPRGDLRAAFRRGRPALELT